MGLTCRDGKIHGIKIINSFYVEDDRGYFNKVSEKGEFEKFGIKMDIYEEFETYSKRNVIRGMHFQTCCPQGKLVSVLNGNIIDIAVDLRKGSPTFGQWERQLLSKESHQAFWVPAGFAHGFEVISDHAWVSYKCVGKYLQEFDTGILWNDADINIRWNTKDPVLSVKDRSLMSFQEFQEKYGGLECNCESGGGILKNSFRTVA